MAQSPTGDAHGLGTVVSALLPGTQESLTSSTGEPSAAVSSEEAIAASLASLRRHLGMEVAFVGRIENGRRIFDFVDAESPDCPVQPGLSDPIEDSYCGRVISRLIPQLIPDARLEPGVADLAATHELPVGAHLSVPLRRANGEVMGTLCCFSHEPDDTLRQRDLQLMSMFAEIVSAHLEKLVDGDRERADRRARICAVLDDGGPIMALQPIVHMPSRRVRGFEALSRFPVAAGWDPPRWFAEADAVGLGVELEASAVARALAEMPRLPSSALLSVNVSAEAIRSDTVLRQLTGEHAGRLVVELTEHTRIEDYSSIADELAALRSSGARVAVDDAGSGWAGLEHILQLQPEVLKLDRTLITRIDLHAGRQAMVEAMVGFADRMGALLIAEGVETAEELACLTSLGVEFGQGYLLGRPSLTWAEGLEAPPG